MSNITTEDCMNFREGFTISNKKDKKEVEKVRDGSLFKESCTITTKHADDKEEVKNV